ncbi:MAG: DHHA1 domain-containing protein [bacterium]|nr:DHHA1 domain-containing protein [bacterium]
MTHDNPDPDALASSLALQVLIKAKKSLKPYIGIGGILGRAENRVLSLEIDLNVNPIELVVDKPWDAIVMVDAQPGSGNSTLPSDLPITAVIDHHPSHHPVTAEFVDIRPEYGAVSTLLVEYLLAQEVKLESKLATALFYAIKSETSELGLSICDADQRAYFALFGTVDWELHHRIMKAEIPGDYFTLYHRGIANACLFGNVVVSRLGEIPVPDAVAELADFLLRHENADRTLVIGRYEDQIVYSIRFTPSDLSAGNIAGIMARELGTGGGHDHMAGGRILSNGRNRKKIDEIEAVLIDRFLTAVGAEQFKPGVPLLLDSQHC